MVIYVVSLYTQCLRYNICSAWYLDIRISTCIPLNMTILLRLVEDGIDRLPKTQTKIYKRFIETTIIRFIKKM